MTFTIKKLAKNDKWDNEQYICCMDPGGEDDCVYYGEGSSPRSAFLDACGEVFDSERQSQTFNSLPDNEFFMQGGS